MDEKSLVEKKLIDGAKALGIELNEEQLDLFFRFMRMLQDWNKKVNLTSITEDEDIVVKHFLDSLLAARYIQNGEKLLDVGSGGGFPGVPIKILNPLLEVTLLDSIRKKAEYLKQVDRKLGLDMQLVNMRAEEAGRDVFLRERYDWVISRAVADFVILAEFCLPLTKVGGCFLAMKADDIERELEEAKYAFDLLGGAVEKTLYEEIPGTNIKRSLVFVKKNQPTPKKYPRRTGIPEKRPLFAPKNN